jgi:hypothetical protein
MTALLYSSKLTKEEKLSIDKSVLENRLAVRNFVKKVYGKSEVIVISTRLGILILFSGTENVDEIRLSTLPQVPIMKLDSRIDSAKFISSNAISQNKRTFIQISQIDKTCVEHPENSLDGLLELRGEDMNPLTKILFKIVLI